MYIQLESSAIKVYLSAAPLTMEQLSWKIAVVSSVIAAAIAGLMYYSKKVSSQSTDDIISKQSPTPKEPATSKRKGKFDPKAIISKGAFEKPESLPEVEPMGEITVEELNKYDCNNGNRRLISLFGTIFDVTAAIDKYGPEGKLSDNFQKF